MIPIDKEAAVQEMLVAGMLHSVICAQAGVSERTVGRIKRSLALAGSVSAKKRSRARVLVICGLTEPAISARLKLPVEVVRSIKRADFLLASVADVPYGCPTCGGTMLPEGEGEEHKLRRPPHDVTVKHARELFALADEIVGLAKLTTVNNLLFYEIADRAERLTAVIFGENHGEEKRQSRQG